MRFKARALVQLLAMTGLLSTMADLALADGAPVKFVLGQETEAKVETFGCLHEKVAAIFADTVYRPEKYHQLSDKKIASLVEAGICRNIAGNFFVASILIKAPQNTGIESDFSEGISLIKVKSEAGDIIYIITQNPVIGEPTSDDYLERMIGK